MKTSFWSRWWPSIRGGKPATRAPRRRVRRTLYLEELERRTVPSGTPQLVLDVNPGLPSSNPFGLVAVGATTFFTANDGAHGLELWKSDGTSAGTRMVKDIRPGSAYSFPINLTDVGGTLFFTANDGSHGEELWKSDGTSAGTTLVADINPGSASSSPNRLTNVNGTLFFNASDGSHGYELWKSNGTSTGTTLVKDIQVGSPSSNPQGQANVNGTLFFAANDGAHGYELWKSDGTSAGTGMVMDSNPGTTYSFPFNLTNVGGTLFFQNNDGSHGYELWMSNGTSTGTALVKDIFPGSFQGPYGGYYPNSSSPGALTNVGGTLFFAAQDATYGREVWRSDGTAAGTVRLGGSGPSNLTNVSGTLFFSAYDSTHGVELWQSNGTSTGTVLVKDIFPGVSKITYYSYFGGLYYEYLPNRSAPGNLTNVRGLLFFSATDGSHGYELWQSDGTDSGTVLVNDINPGSAPAWPGNLANVNGVLFFAASDGVHGNELWRLLPVTGAPAASLAVSGFPATVTAGSPGSFTVTARKADGTTDTAYTGTVYFTSSDAQAALPSFYTFTAADAGVHTFSATLKTAGTQSLTATYTGSASCTGTDGGITVKPAAASQLAVSAPDGSTAGTAFSVTLTARDPYNNLVTGYAGTVHFGSTDGQATLPADYTFTAADAGSHTFTNAVTLRTAGGQTVTAADTVTASIQGGAAVAVSPAAASTLAVSGFPSPSTAGVAGTFTVMAKDPYGNTASGYVGTVHFTSSDAKAVLPANYTFTAADAGMHTFSATLKTAGAQSITATDTTTPSLSGAEGGITVKPAAASRFVLTGPSKVRAGVPFSLTLTVQDAYGNIVTGYTGTVHLSSTDSTALLPANYTFTATDQGVHTFTGLVLHRKGKQKISITDTLNNSLTASVTERVT